MNGRIEALALTIALGLVVGCAEVEDPAVTEEPADTTATAQVEVTDIRTAIETANARFVESMNAGDVAGAARGIYTEDAAIYPPGAEPVTGREAIIQFWTGATEQFGMTGVELTTVEVEPAGPGMAWEVGEFEIRGADGPLDAGSYLVVWKDTADGWKWHRDMWNSDGAVGGEAEPAGEATEETNTTE